MNAVSYVIEVSLENFQSEVVEKSKSTPVLLEFYADGMEASAQQTQVLRRLAEAYAGKFILARVDVQQNTQIAQQLGVRAIPTIKIVFQGQMTQDIEGPQDEEALRNILDQLTQSPMERIRAQLDQYLEIGDRQNAIAMLQHLISEEPSNHGLKAELADLLIMENQVDEARQLIAGLPDDTEGLGKPKNRIAFLEDAAALPAIDELQAKLANSPDDLQVMLDLATRLVADDQIEPALDLLLEAMKRDKSWNDEVARKTMIKVFDLLGKGNELATAYRRKMFTFLY